MICPHCSEETEAGKVCGRCGRDLGFSKGMEIEYKEFRVSELLDIKMTRQGQGGQSMKKSGARQEKRNTFADDPGPRRKPERVKAWVITTTVMIILALVAGFYLLRFFFGF